MTEETDPLTARDPAAAWTALIGRYYEGCSAGDVDLMLTTLHPDVVHWFLAPNAGSTAVTGAEHLARYWRKVGRMNSARWVVDSICATPDQAVIEWTMWWLPEGASERVATRGAEWFTCREGLIHEIRSYYQLRPQTTELDGFPYAARGYSSPGAEHSAVHPTADRFGPEPRSPEDPDVTSRLTARADVLTEAPARYAKQLVSHLGRRLTWTTEGGTSTAQIGEATGVVLVGDGVLTLLAEAPDEESLARVQHVLGSHLERFGQRNELTVRWTPGD
jgi:ketosteroid isomerase-like protein